MTAGRARGLLAADHVWYDAEKLQPVEVGPGTGRGGEDS